MTKYDEKDGVWRTIGGRRVFIRKGQNLSDAMNESGKFKSLKNEIKYQKMKKEGEQELRRLKKENNYKTDKQEIYPSKWEEEEYNLYKQAMENPDSIDPMTENSTDWEALDKKYRSRYENERNNDEDVYVTLRDPDTGAREKMKWSEAKKIADKSFKNNQEKIKNLMPEYLIPKEERETGYQTYLKDTQGTTNEELINVGREKENRVDYQKYKNEVIRNINQKRMEKGVTNMETAYKRAYEEYKKLHPRTKLSLQDFIRMSEE